MITEIKRPWHNAPVGLSESEIENPNLVLEQFFSNSRLPEYRKLLLNALIAGMEDQYAWEYPDVVDMIYAFDYLEKLMEGLWQLHTAGNNCTAQDIKLREAPGKGNINWSPIVKDALTWFDYEESQFYTNKLNQAEEENPYLVINDLFRRNDLGDLKIQLKFWCRTALTNPWTYVAMDKEEMAGLYKTVERVVEAAFVLNEIYQLKKKAQH